MTENTFNYKPYYTAGVYQCMLNFNQNTYDKIIEQMYEMENNPENMYSSDSRTFILNKGFHSCNLLNPETKILETYNYIKILVSRIQELLYNYFCIKNNIDFTVKPHILKINEIWFNILRHTDYNIPHNHPNSYISGNFYLKIPSKKKNPSDGSLMFLKQDNHNFFLPDCVKNERRDKLFVPTVGSGIIFQSHLKHIVMPHFTDEDRIGIAFNATIDYNYHYDKIYPTPYWLPIDYTFKFNKEQYKNGQIIINLKNTQTIKIPYDKDKINEMHGKIIHVAKQLLKSIINNYTIDKNKYFINNLSDDYFLTNNKKWNDNDHYYYENNNSKNLLIIFSGMGQTNTPPTFIFNNFLKQYNCDKLFLRDLEYSWFLNNNNFKTKNSINNSNILNTSLFIKSFIQKRHTKIYTLGCSSGGYAAILYGNLLKVNACLGFSPQTILNETKELKFNDLRWSNPIQTLRKHVKNINLDLNNFIPFNMKTKIYVSDKIDLKHANNIKHDNCEIIEIEIKETNFNKHLTALYMKKNKTLKKTIDNFFNI